MSRVSSKRIKEIEEQLIGRTGHKVLLVEGPDDSNAFSAWLNNAYGAVWENQWVIASAGKKSLVLEILSEKPEWLGIIDRDEWSADRITSIESEYPNLFVLPRFCIENYLCVPEELWQALPSRQQAKISGGFADFEARLSEDIQCWAKHGALWAEVNPLWEGLRSKGFKEALLDPEIVSNEQLIREKLEEWHNFLEPARIYNAYQSKVAQIEEYSQIDQLRLFIHGKKFFDTVVNPLLGQLLGQKRSGDRQKSIFRHMPVPADLAPLWHRMGLQ